MVPERRALRCGAVSDPIISMIPFDSEPARASLRQAKAELDRRYGGSSDGAELPTASFTPPNGAFLVATVDEEPVGCVGVRQVAPGAGEIKRLWVDARFRQQGVATMLMDAVEEIAASLGFELLVLETGWAQPEAVAFYESKGWRRVDELPVPIEGHPAAYRYVKP